MSDRSMINRFQTRRASSPDTTGNSNAHRTICKAYQIQMSLLEGTRKDLWFSGLSSEELQQLEEIDSSMDLNNWQPKERTFSSPEAEIKWRTDKLLKDIDGFNWVKPDYKPPKLDEFKQRVLQAIADATTMDVMTDQESDVWEKVRKLSEEMEEIQHGHKTRMWAVFEEMDREIQADPDYLDKIGVPKFPSDDEEDEKVFDRDEEDMESSDDDEWAIEEPEGQSERAAGKRPV